MIVCDSCGKPPAECTCDLERAALDDWAWSSIGEEHRNDGLGEVPDDGFHIYGADHGFRGR
jgi:hypothetical protein